jgi:Xaa-Pro aminopeptidase
MNLGPTFHKKNIKNLGKLMENNSIFFLESKDEIIKGDGECFNFSDENIFYFTGINQSKTKLIIYKNKLGDLNTNLFILDKNPQIEMWDGEKISKIEAKKVSGIKNIYYMNEYENISKDLFSNVSLIYFSKNEKLKIRNKSEYEINYTSIKRKYKLKSENAYNKICKLRQKKI